MVGMTQEEDKVNVTRRQILRYSAAGMTPALMPALLHGAGKKDAVAKTSSGMVRGRVENGIFVYRGVPYGMDTAQTRFAAPKPPAPWDGVKDCVTWGPRTIQPYAAPPAPRKTPAPG